MLVVYDGDCPFCSNYVRFMALRKSVGKVELLNARSGDRRVIDLWRAGYDLNEGMAVVYGDVVYYGGDAVMLLSTLSSDNGAVRRWLARLLRNPARAKLLYPAMKAGRRLALRLLRRPDLASPLSGPRHPT